MSADPSTPARPGRSRGRVVMLVDNGVEGDSRVQKQARSIAERGWDVVLLGRSPDHKPHRWRLGAARVRLLPVPGLGARRPHEFRRAPLRSPLAYPAGRVPDWQRRRAEALRADVHTARTLHARRADEAGWRRAAASAWLLGRRAWVKAQREWIGLRVARTERLREARREMDSPLDRFTTAAWQRLLGERAWRRLDPSLWCWELAYGPVIDELAPDLVHANDFRMLGVGARAVLRARMDGRRAKLVWDAHDYLPGINPWNSHPRWHPAMIAHEREFAPYADAVVTVSETMCDLLTEQHALSTAPVIVRNAPTTGLAEPAEPDGLVGVREVAGLAADVPLLVYVGVMTQARGVDLVVRALPRLPDVHVVFVARESEHLDRVRALADELGVRARMHVAPYVAVDQICRYLCSADVGVWPGRHLPNHEVDLPTKFYEYAQARLPMVVSDLRTVAETTRRYGQGEVFRADDLDDFVRAVEQVLADPARYRASYDRPEPWAQWMWEAQADVLDGVYRGLVEEGT